MSIQVQRRASGLPCAMALRLISRSPRRRILVCHRHRRISGWPSPVELVSPPPTWHQQRMPEPHGFAVRSRPSSPKGSSGLRRRSSACRWSLTSKLALPSRVTPDAAASTAPRPAFVTLANAPLGGTGWPIR